MPLSLEKIKSFFIKTVTLSETFHLWSKAIVF